ncbi:MAG: hypothetical protein M1840_002257 [Geoglossum simile]|nr:MAG: hypothetical protein M1840_002257 [Geoglossum simile]
MSRLSRALKRLRGKSKQTKDESAPSNTSATVVTTSPPLQSAEKIPPTQLLAQGSHGLSSASKVTAPILQKPTSLSRETWQAGPPSARKISRPVFTFTEVALRPGPQPALIESPKETPQSEPQRELLDAEEVEGQSVVPNAPEKLAQQPSPLGKAPAVNPLPQPAPRPAITEPKARRQTPKPTVTAPKAKPQTTPEATRQIPKPTIAAPKAKPQPTPKATRQTPRPAVTAPKAKPQTTPKATRQTPKPTVAAPKAKPQPTPKATRQTPKPTPNLVPIPRPAVQTHASLYSGFSPSVAAVDQPAPKTLLEAQKTAFNVLHGESPFGPGVPATIRHYTRPGDYNAAIPGPSTVSSRPSYAAGFSNIHYASPLPYSSARPLGTFRTGGPLGGGQYSSTGGAIGGGTIAQTGGRFGEGSVSRTGGSLGEGSVSRTGGSLGEGLGVQGFDSRD